MELRLPSEYQEVEYIESTGTQYIDTGVTLGTNDFTILFNFEQTKRATGEQPITSIWTNDYNYWNLFIRSVSSDESVLDVYTSAHHMLSTEVNLNEKYTVSLTRNENSWELTQDDSTISWTYSPSKINNTTLKLFKRGDLTNAHSTKIKMYSFKMAISNTKTLNLIPCYRKSNGEIGMYDTVTKTFYTNSGTDIFLKGADVTRYIDNVSVLDTRRKILLNTPHIDTSVGDLVTFNTDLSAPLKSCKVSFLPVQEGEGDPSPDNVREITGWNGVSVGLPSEYQEVEWIQSTEEKQFILLPYGFEETDTVTITASIDTEYVHDKFIIAPTTWNNNKNRFAMAGVYSSTYCIGYGNHLTSTTFLKPNTKKDGDMHTWTFANKIFEITDLGLSIDVSDITFGGVTSNLKLFYGYNRNTNGKLSYYKHVKLNGEVYEFIPCYRKSDGEIGLYDIKNHVFYTNNGTGSFLKGKDVNNITTNINWTNNIGTVYGGYVDLVSGELVVDKAMVTLDEDDIIGINVEGQNCRIIVESGKISIFDSYRDGVCNKAVVKTSWLGVAGDTSAIGINNPKSNQFVANNAFGTTLQEIKKFVETDGLQICTYLAEPIHYQLTPQQLLTLKGINNVYSDTNGQTEIKYWKH